MSEPTPVAGSESTVTEEEARRIDGCTSPIVAQRDIDGAPDLPAGSPQLARYRRRVAFLDRVGSQGELVFRRDGWPMLVELGLGVDDQGEWKVRVQVLVFHRESLKAARLDFVYTADPEPTRGPDRRADPLRISLCRAVRSAIVDSFEHETSESLYYKGARLLDPHADEA